MLGTGTPSGLGVLPTPTPLPIQVQGELWSSRNLAAQELTEQHLAQRSLPGREECLRAGPGTGADALSIKKTPGAPRGVQSSFQTSLILLRSQGLIEEAQSKKTPVNTPSGSWGRMSLQSQWTTSQDTS